MDEGEAERVKKTNAGNQREDAETTKKLLQNGENRMVNEGILLVSEETFEHNGESNGVESGEHYL